MGITIRQLTLIVCSLSVATALMQPNPQEPVEYDGEMMYNAMTKPEGEQAQDEDLPAGVVMYDGPMMNSEQQEPSMNNELGFAPPTTDEGDQEGVIRPPPEVEDEDLFLAAGGPGKYRPPPPPPDGEDPNLFLAGGQPSTGSNEFIMPEHIQMGEETEDTSADTSSFMEDEPLPFEAAVPPEYMYGYTDPAEEPAQEEEPAADMFVLPPQEPEPTKEPEPVKEDPIVIYDGPMMNSGGQEGDFVPPPPPQNSDGDLFLAGGPTAGAQQPSECRNARPGREFKFDRLDGGNPPQKGCFWLSWQDIDTQMDHCMLVPRARELCPVTCNMCQATCEDDFETKFEVMDKEKPKDCAWLYKRPILWATECDPSRPAWGVCKNLCDNCSAR